MELTVFGWYKIATCRYQVCVLSIWVGYAPLRDQDILCYESGALVIKYFPGYGWGILKWTMFTRRMTILAPIRFTVVYGR